MSITIDFTGRVVAITGGARGVGDGIVEAFLTAGAEVEICGRTTPETLRSHEGREVVFRAADVRDPAQVADWIADIVGRRGRLDVLVNNAGGAPWVPFAEASPRLHEKVTALNLLSAAHVTQAAYPALAETGGSVVNITSISSRRASPGTAIYGAAKAGLESLTTSLAVEWGGTVRVNAVSCGLVATEGSTDHYGDAEQYAAVAATIPRGVFATPLDVGNACVLLASDLASHISGAVLNVDGGGEVPAFLQHTPNG